MMLLRGNNAPPIRSGANSGVLHEELREVRGVVEPDAGRDCLELFAGLNEEPLRRLDAELRHVDLEGQAHLLAKEGREMIGRGPQRNRPSEDGNWYFDAFGDPIGPDEVTLNFIQWFDWNRYGRREFQYYLVNIAAFPSHPEFEGRGALVERKSTRVLFDSTP